MRPRFQRWRAGGWEYAERARGPRLPSASAPACLGCPALGASRQGGRKFVTRAGGRRPPYATVGGACVRRRAATNAAGGTAQRGRLVAFTEDLLMELL